MAILASFLLCSCPNTASSAAAPAPAPAPVGPTVKHAVTFNANGSGAKVTPSTMKVPLNDTVSFLPEPSREGSRFTEWNTKPDGTGTKFDEDTKVTRDITLYAKWNAISYTVSFDSCGGSAISSISAGHKSKINPPSPPLKNGYALAGWYKDEALDSVWNFTRDSVSDDITLYAKWTPAQYTITYHLAGGTNNSDNPANYTIETADIALKAPTWGVFPFLGWFDNARFEDTALSGTVVPHGSTGNKEFWAKWDLSEYTVSFNSQGGSDVTAQTVYKDSKVTEPASAPTKAGYNFAGWFKEEGCINSWIFNTNTVSADITLYAKWTGKSHSLKYEGNGGSGTVNLTSAIYPAPITVAVNAFTREGYTFKGWNTRMDGTGTPYAANDTFSFADSGETTLYAQWTGNSHILTYDGNGGSGTMANATARYPSTFTVASNSFTRTGYNFKGWNTKADGTGTAYAPSSTYGFTDSGETKLFAKWELCSYTIRYVLAGGTNASANPDTYTYGTAITLENPGWNPYEFQGWFDNEACTGTAIASIPSTSTGDKTFWAKWNATLCTVSFNSQGGSAVASRPVYNGQKVTAPANPTKAGFAFGGWYKDEGYAAAWDFNTDTVTENITLFAKWVNLVPVTVSYTIGQTLESLFFNPSTVYIRKGIKLTTKCSNTALLTQVHIWKWRVNGVLIPGQTNSTLVWTPTEPGDYIISARADSQDNQISWSGNFKVTVSE